MMKLLIPIFLLLILFLIGCGNIESEEKDTIGKGTPVKQIKEIVNMKLSSPAFEHNQGIPPEYTCDGADTSPELNIQDIPENTKSLVLINDDPDAPVGTWDHWIVFNIPPTTKNIEKGKQPQGVGGKNSWGRTGYGGPCPPSGTHRYFFKLYALDAELDLAGGSSKGEIENAMGGHVIDQVELIGTYKKQ